MSSTDGRVPVLCYHSLTTEATDKYRPFAIDPGRFREQMAAVAEAGRTTMTVGDYAATLVSAGAGGQAAPGDGTVILTFDDGFRELHRLVLPVLADLGLRATAYLVTGHIDGTSTWLAGDGEGDRPLVSWTEAGEIADAGIEIGAHGFDHLALDTLSDVHARDDIVRSHDLLEDRLGRPITTFAYPYGYHTGRIKGVVQAAGFISACGVKQALSHPDDDRWAIARILVYADTDPETFRAWLGGEGLPLGWRGEKLATRGWRAYRRLTAAASR